MKLAARLLLVIAPLALGAACSSADRMTPTSDAALEGRDAATSPDASGRARDAAIEATRDAAPRDAADDAKRRGDGRAPVDAGDIAALYAEADQALDTLLLSYWSQSAGYLVDSPGGATKAGYWIFAQAFDALLDGVERTGGEHYLGLVQTFYAAQEAIGFSRDYFDDENWMTLALIRAYDLTGDATYLTEAETLYADIMTNGWDTTCCGATPGGVWWDRAHTQKATASNAGPALAGARLAERTTSAAYLPFAEEVYAYWLAHMVDPTTHQVFDHITSSGSIVKWKFTYNEGLFIGASVELAAATKDASYLTSAEPVAGFMLANETTTGSLGLALYDGTSAGCTGDCAQFKGIGFRYLASLVAAAPKETAARSLLASSAASVWGLARDTSTGRFATNWVGPSVASPPLEADGSAAMALGVYASLAGPYVSDGSKNKVLQAEEATIAGVGLEASNAGYHGWGYVAGWNADGQSVTFTFAVPTSASYVLTFRFAAGAGTAARRVTLDGATTASKVTFASTGAWGTYATVPVTLLLTAGTHAVAVVYDSSAGSTNYMNLDEVTIAAAP